MRFRYIKYLLCIVSFGWSQAPDHLIFSRIMPGDTDGEAVEIKNPTSEDIFLGDYYITDASKPADSPPKYYYNLPSGENFWSNSISDFIARFPGDTISAGSSIILSLHDSARYFNYYNTYPNNKDGATITTANPARYDISVSLNAPVQTHYFLFALAI